MIARLAAVPFGLFLGALASPALADPCEAIPERGRLPAWVKPGARFGGVVRYVGDGDTLCVGTARDPRTWIEVRFTDFFAPELDAPGGRAAQRALQGLALGRPVECRIEGDRRGKVRSHDRLLAVCRRDGRPLGELMRRAGVREGGNR